MRITLLFCFLTLLSLNAFAGGSGGSTPSGNYVNDCMNAGGICSSNNYSFPNSTNVSSYGGFDCMSTSPNPVWYNMQVDDPGQIDIRMSQTSGDIDFVIWGPFTSLQEGCNNLTDNNVVDCSYSTAATETGTIANAQSGEVYILLMTNYANSSGTISFNQTNANGSGAGSMNCNVVCDIQSATFTPSACNPATGTYSLSANISVYAPPTTGSAVIKSSCGDSVIVNAPFGSTITATISNLTASGGSCSATIYFTDNPQCTTTLNYFAPAACNPCPVNASSNGPICVGDTLRLSTDVTSGVSWTGPNGFTSNQVNPVIPNVTAAAAGDYVATYTTGTCTSRSTVNVSLVNQPTITHTAPSYTICSGDTLQITLSSNDANAQFIWATILPPNDTIAGNTNLISGVMTNPTTSPINLTFVAMASVGACQSQPVQIPVVIGNLPLVNAGLDRTVCRDMPVTLNATGAQTYAWSNGVINNVPFIPSQTTTYTVTGTSAQGCTAIDDVIVTVQDSLSPSFVPDVLEGCSPLTVNFSSTNDTTFRFIWNFGNATIDSLSGANATQTFTSPGCYDITLEVISPFGCRGSLFLEDLICVYDSPEALFIAQPAQVDLIDSKVRFINNSTGATMYTWNFGDGSALNNEVNPSHIFPNIIAANYNVTLYAYNAFGCVDSMKSYVRVVEDIIFYIPNAFTPDGDEFNNVFKPIFYSGFDPHDYYFRVYNRWGELIFESLDVEYGWDGVYQSVGKLAPEGSYVWDIEFKTLLNDERKKYQGHFTLLK